MLIWILWNMLLMFWLWTYHRNVCLNFLFAFFILFKRKNQKAKKKKNLSVQLRAWDLKLPSMKSSELGARPPNDSKFPQGLKPKSPLIHPMLNGHDLQMLLVFKMCIFKKKKNLWIFFSKECVFSRSRIALLLEWVKFKIFKTHFQIVLKEVSLM